MMSSPPPVFVHAEHVRIAHNDEQGLGAGQSHVEPLEWNKREGQGKKKCNMGYC